MKSLRNAKYLIFFGLLLFITIFPLSVVSAESWVFTGTCRLYKGTYNVMPPTSFTLTITGNRSDMTMLARVDSITEFGTDSESGTYGAKRGTIRTPSYTLDWDKVNKMFVLAGAESCFLRGDAPPPLHDDSQGTLSGDWKIFQTNHNGAQYQGKLALNANGNTLSGNAYWVNHEQGQITGTVNGNSVDFVINYSKISGKYIGTYDPATNRITGTGYDSKGISTCTWYAIKEN